MSYTFSVNNYQQTGAESMWTLISTLKLAGWTQVNSSDGTTMGQNQVIHGASGGQGLGNSYAWVVVRAPTTITNGNNTQARSLCFQRGTSSWQWRIKYSATGGFIGSNANQYNTPTNRLSDVYIESNQSGVTSLRSGSTVGAGQSFTGDGYTLYSTRLYLKKSGSPTGYAYAKIYEHSGSYGTTSVPTGDALATSVAFDVSTLTGSYALTELKFINANAITLENGTNYIISIEYSGGSVGNTLDVGTDTSTPTHDGNFSTYDGGSWTAVAGTDMCFYIATGIQDEVVLYGAGTDVYPTITNWFSTADYNWKWHVCAGGADEGYSFYAFATDNSSLSYIWNGIFLDVMQPGTYQDNDIDPAVIYCSAGAGSGFFSSYAFSISGAALSTYTNPAYARAWMGPLSWCQNSTTTNNLNVGLTSPGGSGTNGILGGGTLTSIGSFSNTNPLIPCCWVRPNASIMPSGIKGYSSLFLLVGTRTHNMCPINVYGTRTRLAISSNNTDTYSLPWNGSVPWV